jgi:hypothetical protein
MEICFTLAGKRHCYLVPVLEWPVIWKKPGPGPVNYPPFIQDAIILAALQNGVAQVSEASVRTALQGGLKEAVAALQRRAGSEVSINMTAAD